MTYVASAVTYNPDGSVSHYTAIPDPRCEATTRRGTRCKFPATGTITEGGYGIEGGYQQHEVCRIHYHGPIRWW